MNEILTFFLVVGGALGIRFVAGRLDRDRIREYVEGGGGEVLEIVSNPWGPGWWGSPERIYDVRFKTKHGQIYTGTCKTSMFASVYWTGHAPPSPEPESVHSALETDEAINCLRCGSRMLPRQSKCPKCGWSFAG